MILPTQTKMKTFSFFLLLILFSLKNLYCKSFLSKDFDEMLSKTYVNNPDILEERNKLFQIDELMPQAYSNFSPKINGFYEKGKVDLATAGSNLISDGVRTETSKGIKITQPIFEGGSNVSKILEAEKAHREREQEQQRQSQEWLQDITNRLVNPYEEYQKEKEKQEELLRTIPPSLTPFYKNKVNEYFQNDGR